jgi:phosphoglycolate phosphatase-like HAD superfamily hydrolase
VKTNLQAGWIRMLFVADRIPAELRRIVEFLNEQMDPAEVLALELRQFQGEGLRTIVPMLYGQTEEAQQKNRVQASRQWDEASILAEIERRHGAEALSTAKQIVEWIKTKGQTWFGSGSKDGSVGVTVNCPNGSQSYPIAVYSYYGQVEIRFQYMRKPFDDPAKREELRKKLNNIEGINLPSGRQRPSIPIATLSNDDEKLRRFLDVMDWCIGALRSG